MIYLNYENTVSISQINYASGAYYIGNATNHLYEIISYYFKLYLYKSLQIIKLFLFKLKIFLSYKLIHNDFIKNFLIIISFIIILVLAFDL